MLKSAASQCEEPGSVPSGVSQVSKGCKSFPDKSHVISELFCCFSRSEVYQRGWRGRGQKDTGICLKPALLQYPLVWFHVALDTGKSDWTSLTVTIMTLMSPYLPPSLCRIYLSTFWKRSTISILQMRKLSPHRFSPFLHHSANKR